MICVFFGSLLQTAGHFQSVRLAIIGITREVEGNG
jgi:hypothetical protein